MLISGCVLCVSPNKQYDMPTYLYLLPPWPIRFLLRRSSLTIHIDSLFGIMTSASTGLDIDTLDADRIKMQSGLALRKGHRS